MDAAASGPVSSGPSAASLSDYRRRSQQAPAGQAESQQPERRHCGGVIARRRGKSPFSHDALRIGCARIPYLVDRVIEEIVPDRLIQELTIRSLR